MKEYHVLNLGAGIQSTCLYLMDKRLNYGGHLHFDVAIFADTQAEPQAVYDHLEWLKSLNGPPIWIRTQGSLEKDLLKGQNSTGGKFVTIPAHTAVHHSRRYPKDQSRGMGKRQCTFHYKIVVIERAVRYELLGLRPRQRVPKDIHVHQYFGITVDEARRMVKIKERYTSIYWAEPHFPLIEKLAWSRRGCIEWLKDKVPHPTPRSACVFCPLRTDHEWKKMKEQDPESWQRAVKTDQALRQPGIVVNRKVDQSFYLHRQCTPLKMVDFNNLPPQTLDPMTLTDCLGMCGV